jgi:hypothetical protein
MAEVPMRNPLIFVAAALVASLVAGCGGGGLDGSSASVPFARLNLRSDRDVVIATAQSTDAGKQFAALAQNPDVTSPSPDPYGGVNPVDAVNQLFAFAVKKFPQYFPSLKEILRSDPFDYAFYQETSIYLGVAHNVGTGSPYLEGGVYVLGGAFGNSPTYVGQLINFVTPFSTVQVAPIPPPTAGDFVQLSAVFRNSSGNTVVGQAVSWSSDNPAVAKVTQTGMLLALGAGQVNINASAGSQSTVLSTSVSDRAVPAGEVLFLLGPEETVFDFQTQRCDEFHTPDVAAHPVRMADGSLVLYSIPYSFRGPDFWSLSPNCNLYGSTSDTTAQSYKNQEWLSGFYRIDGTVHSLIHNEYHDPFAAGCHPGDLGPGNPCWYNSITYASSIDGGRTFASPSSPQNLVAPAPRRWDPTDPQARSRPEGYFNPSNIISRRDGYYYSMFLSIPDPHAPNVNTGLCVMRTATLADPSSWRAWDGSSYSLQMISPYTLASAATACKVVQPSGLFGSLTYNTYLQQYMVMSNAAVYPDGVNAQCGFHYSLSADLVTWTDPIRFKAANLPTFNGASICPPANGNEGAEIYPSIVDHESSSVNFEEAGQTSYVYFTRYTSSSSDVPRNLIRQPLIVLKSKTQGSDFTHPTGHLDSPTNNEVISGTSHFFGWAFDDVSVSSVEILLDGVQIGVAAYGSLRPDIPAAFPRAPANCGFDYDFVSARFPNGPHVVAFRAVDPSGNATTFSASITVSN